MIRKLIPHACMRWRCFDHLRDLNQLTLLFQPDFFKWTIVVFSLPRWSTPGYLIACNRSENYGSLSRIGVKGRQREKRELNV
jgi:hypothetical protein